MSERVDKVKPSSVIVEVMVKSWHKWSFAVGVGKKFVVKRKGGDRGSTFEGLLAVAVHDIFFFCPSKSK